MIHWRLYFIMNLLHSNKSYTFKKLIRNLRLKKEVSKNEKDDYYFFNSNKYSRTDSQKN